MIEAELHGRTGVQEDRLTSSVFGLLSLLPPKEGMLAVLREARAFQPVSAQLVSLEVESAELDYWPTTAGYGVPDLLAILSRGGRPVCALAIEAKYSATKSQKAADGKRRRGEERPWDQLHRYWTALAQAAFPARPELRADDLGRAVLYLTADAAAPEAELAESASQDPTMRLGWLSWRHVHSVVRDFLKRHHGEPGAEVLAAQDILRLLSFYGMVMFDSFHQSEWPTEPVAWVFRPCGFGQVSAPPLPESNEEWRYRRNPA